MNELKKPYSSPNLDKVMMDNDISLALESPWSDPEAHVIQEQKNDSHLA